VLEGVILLPLLHVIVELAGLGEHALDASRCGRAAKELRRHLGQVRQASRAAAHRVGRLVVVARLPPRQDVEVVVGLPLLTFTVTACQFVFYSTQGLLQVGIPVFKHSRIIQDFEYSRDEQHSRLECSACAAIQALNGCAFKTFSHSNFKVFKTLPHGSAHPTNRLIGNFS